MALVGKSVPFLTCKLGKLSKIVSEALPLRLRRGMGCTRSGLIPGKVKKSSVLLAVPSFASVPREDDKAISIMSSLGTSDSAEYHAGWKMFVSVA